MAIQITELSPQTLETDAWVYLTVRSTEGKALTVTGGIHGKGEAVAAVQWSWRDDVPYQLWQVQWVDNEYYKLVAKYSGKVLTVAEASTDDGAAVVQASWRGGDNQLWRSTPLQTGGLMLTAKHSGKVLDVNGDSMGDGAALIQWPAKSQPNQTWHMWQP
ncbi:RICIN domain-containing protein [Streptomyces desertarenae]|uniref:RICIN domain-containing protein n=1 Tax=Streptomyces desertarenae TaxID=2666184 RepID=A0ABW4PH17_9ACTN